MVEAPSSVRHIHTYFSCECIARSAPLASATMLSPVGRGHCCQTAIGPLLTCSMRRSVKLDNDLWLPTSGRDKYITFDGLAASRDTHMVLTTGTPRQPQLDITFHVSAATHRFGLASCHMDSQIHVASACS